jgi:TM2 domain-containing membrane protein YozV/DNA uptake protein ComE-like DNA-binding protein
MKDRTTAMLLCLFLGHIGMHKFYLGKKNEGILYLVFFWTWIPLIIAVCEFIGLCFMSDREFNNRFNNSSRNRDRIDSASSYWISRITPIINKFFSQTEVKIRGKVVKNVDINTSSIDDLVHLVGIPSIYADNIELIRAEGYHFLNLEDLTQLADLPEDYCRKIEPLIAFTYYEQFANSDATNWQRLNSLSMPELIELELDRDVAMKICDERHQNGEYRALVEVKRRTGLPISAYKHLINASDRN